MTSDDFARLESGRVPALRYGPCIILRARGNFVFHGPSGRQKMHGEQDYDRVAAHFTVFRSHPTNLVGGAA